MSILFDSEDFAHRLKESIVDGEETVRMESLVLPNSDSATSQDYKKLPHKIYFLKCTVCPTMIIIMECRIVNTLNLVSVYYVISNCSMPAWCNTYMYNSSIKY